MSAEIAEWQITQARGSLTQSLPDMALVRHRIGTSDGRGGQSVTYDAGTELRCRLLPMGREAQGREEATGHKASSWWYVLLPAGSDVRVTDRIEIGSDVYEVVDHIDARSQSLVMRVSARRVK